MSGIIFNNNRASNGGGEVPKKYTIVEVFESQTLLVDDWLYVICYPSVDPITITLDPASPVGARAVIVSLQTTAANGSYVEVRTDTEQIILPGSSGVQSISAFSTDPLVIVRAESTIWQVESMSGRWSPDAGTGALMVNSEVVISALRQNLVIEAGGMTDVIASPYIENVGGSVAIHEFCLFVDMADGGDYFDISIEGFSMGTPILNVSLDVPHAATGDNGLISIYRRTDDDYGSLFGIYGMVVGSPARVAIKGTVTTDVPNNGAIAIKVAPMMNAVTFRAGSYIKTLMG